jgi:orotate phosphoribosyltransferase
MPKKPKKAKKDDQDNGSAVVEGKGKGVYYFSTGSLLNTEYKGRSFNLYEINNNTITYFFHAHLDTMKDPYWDKIEDGIITIEEQDVSKNITTKVDEEEKEEFPGDNKQDEDKQLLIEYIGRHKLYYSDHFHWNTNENTGKSDIKTHGYIDINYLVSHNESLESITRLFRTKIDDIKNQFGEKLGKTIMVSIGMECIVIGARLSVLYPEYDFSYIPRRRKADDHNDIEQRIGLNIDDYDTIILIKDIIVQTAESETKAIIRENYYGKNIHLISLFYCGKEKDKKEILNDIENAHFYSLIDDIKIPVCEMIESKCPIIKNKLQTIYRC